MSKKRQTVAFDRRSLPGAAVTTLSYLYTPKDVVPPHFHEYAQVLYASSGAMTVSAESSIWVIPPERAVWIPPGVQHSIKMHSAVFMKSIYLRSSLSGRMPRTCVVLNVSPLLKELLIRSCASPTLSLRRKREANLIAVVLDELQASTHMPLGLSLPRDERALRVAHQLMDNPAEDILHALRIAGAARRTLERIFVRETGITFGKWRQQLSLIHAVRLLGEGWKVASVAEACGYESTSAFVAMFKKRLGTTPAKYSTTQSEDGVNGSQVEFVGRSKA